MIIKYISMIILLCLVSTSSWAATYYVDFTAGSDAAAGTSTGTAWKRVKGMTGGDRHGLGNGVIR
jgi:hypothetical protein